MDINMDIIDHNSNVSQTFQSESTQTQCLFDDQDAFKERRLSKRLCKQCFVVCCGGVCKCSLALVVAINVVISLSLLITLLFIFSTIRSIAHQMNADSDGDLYGEKCFDSLGCFPKLYGCLIPTVTTPQSPQQLGVKFHLFANNFHQIFESIDDIHIEMSEFNASFDTKVIIHGFKNGFTDGNWMGKLKNLFVINGNGMYNVIAVDWSKGANNIKYWKAAASTNVVGAIVAQFIQKLIDMKKADITRFHLIGHSLGAHISGVVGYHFPYPKVSRITGLDPAGPCFFKLLPVNRDPKEYLDSEDATIVETIHTNGEDLGFISTKTLSHYEFYPNGGKRQPGCHSILDVSAALHDDTGNHKNISLLYITIGCVPQIPIAFGPRLSCSHAFAHELVIYNYSQYSDCQPIAYNCPDWQSFSNGQCDYDCTDQKCQIMALGIQYSQNDFPISEPQMPMKLYIKTTGSQPYCLYRYMVYVRISSGDGEEGVINVTIRGTTDKSVIFDEHFYSDKEYKSELIFSPTNAGALGVVKQIDVNFRPKNSINNNIVVKEVFIKYLSSTLMKYDYICRNDRKYKLSQQMTTYSCDGIH